MILKDAQIPAKCDIVLHGDSHEGNAMTTTGALDDLIHWVGKKPHRYIVHMGDAIEAITTDDKRYSLESNSEPIPLQQAKQCAERYMPVKDRILAWLWGNHETKLERFGNLTKDVILPLLGREDAWGSWTCKLRLLNGDQQVCKMFLAHGMGGVISSQAKDYEQQQANMAAAVKRKLVPKACDCLVMAFGHSHKLIVVNPAQRLVLSDDGEDVQQNYLGAGDGAADYIDPDRRWYINTGSFLRLYQAGIEGYAERAGYDPVELGYSVVHIRKGKVDSVEKVVV